MGGNREEQVAKRIAELQMEIDEAKEELVKLNTWRLVEASFGEPASSPQRDPKPGSTRTAPALGDRMKDVLKEFVNKEFTVNDVSVSLLKSGKGSQSTHFRRRVSGQIRHLVEDGVLRIAHKGKGSEPYKYRVRRLSAEYLAGSND